MSCGKHQVFKTIESSFVNVTCNLKIFLGRNDRNINGHVDN